MYKIIKTFFTLFFILNISINIYAKDINEKFVKPDYDLRLDVDPKAREYYNDADEDAIFSFNIGVIYQKKIKDYVQAEFWYKKSWSMEKNKDTAYNLGYLFEDKKKFDKSIKWYKMAIERVLRL